MNKVNANSPIEERVSELERLWPIMRTKLQQYDKLLDENAQLRKDLTTLRTGLTEVESDIDDICKDIRSHKDQITSKLNDTDANLLSISTAAKASKFVLEQQMKRSDGIELSILNYAKGHGEAINICKQMAEQRLKQEDFDSYKKEAATQVNNILSQHQTFARENQDVSLKVRKLDEMVSSHAGSVVKNAVNIDDLAAKQNIFAEVLKQDSQKLFSLVNSQMQLHKQDLESQVTALREQMNSSTVKQVKEELLKAMDELKLDCSNVNLKAKNHAQQIMLLEKRFESITLQLKNIELSK